MKLLGTSVGNIILYLYAFHDVEFCTSHTCIRAIEQWAWHGEVDLGESRDDSIFPIDSVGPREQMAGGTATKDVLLTCSRTKVVGWVGFTISEDVQLQSLLKLTSMQVSVQVFLHSPDPSSLVKGLARETSAACICTIM